MSRVDSPRTNPAITSASSALVLVTPVPNSWEANRSVVPRSFGDPLQGYGQVSAASEHLVDLCVQPLPRRYPLRHRRGLLPLVA